MSKTKKAARPRRAVPISPIIANDWRTSDKKYRMSSHLSAGMTDHQKMVLRITAERLSKVEGRRVSMSEVARRALASAGVL